MDAKLLETEANRMIEDGLELNQKATEVFLRDDNMGYFFLLRNSLRKEAFGEGILYALGKLGLLEVQK